MNDDLYISIPYNDSSESNRLDNLFLQMEALNKQSMQTEQKEETPEKELKKLKETLINELFEYSTPGEPPIFV